MDNIIYSEMVKGKKYTLEGNSMDNFEKIHFMKADKKLFIVLEGGDFAEPYKWNFQERLIEILLDEQVKIYNSSLELKTFLKNNPLDRANLEDLSAIESQLNCFLTSYNEIPVTLKPYVELPGFE